MSINAKKTVMTVQSFALKTGILVNGTALEVVDSFSYLGSSVSNNLSLEYPQWQVYYNVGEA